jgi:predicted DNA-binding protein
MSMIAARGADQFVIRFPPGVRERVAQRAAENGRSMNTEIIAAIEAHLNGLDRFASLEARVAKLEQKR